MADDISGDRHKVGNLVSAMAEKRPTWEVIERDRDEEVTLPLDPEAALRTLLAVTRDEGHAHAYAARGLGVRAVQDAVVEHLLRIGQPARAEAPVGPKVAVDGGTLHEAAFLRGPILDHLTERSRRLVGVRAG